MSDLIVFPPDASPVIPVLAASTTYEKIIREAFFAHFRPGMTEFVFSRNAINGAALGLSPKNIGDIIYTYRYRRALPQDILDCAPPGRTWIIEGAGTGLYRFRAVSAGWFEPSADAAVISLPDRTPDEVLEAGGSDEQAVLASIAYNRLLDLFLWCRLERKQSHWRTTVSGIGQIEIDDVYVGVDGHTGKPIVVTVQAKRDRDRINSVQIMQDIRACQAKNDGRVCRPVAVHHDSSTRRLALLEFTEEDGDAKLVRECHYILQKQRFLF